MQVELSKKTIKVVLVGILSLVLLAGAVLLYFLLSNESYTEKIYRELKVDSYECIIPKEYNLFFNDRVISTPGDNDYWQLNLIKPVVVDYATYDNTEFLIGAVKDATGSCRHMVFVLSGDFPELKNFKDVYYSYKVFLEDESISVKEFKALYPKGKQVNGLMLTKRPADTIATPEFCNKEENFYWCALQGMDKRFPGVTGSLRGKVIEDKHLIFISEWRLTDEL